MSEKRDMIIQAIGESLGEASMCWEETPKGDFDSSRCLAIRDKLVDRIQLHLGMGMSRYIDIMDKNHKLELENAHLKSMIEVMEAQQDKIMSELTNMHDNTISLNLHESRMWALEKQLAEAKEEADLWRKRSAVEVGENESI